jgi:hypothetical protein
MLLICTYSSFKTLSCVAPRGSESRDNFSEGVRRITETLQGARGIRKIDKHCSKFLTVLKFIT